MTCTGWITRCDPVTHSRCRLHNVSTTGDDSRQLLLTEVEQLTTAKERGVRHLHQKSCAISELPNTRYKGSNPVTHPI
jgi:hypothetical protein